MTDNFDYLRRMQELSERYSISILEINRLVRAAVMASIDPIEADGEVFMFKSQLPRQCAAEDEPGFGNFWHFNTEVPEINARVDLLIARRE
jgi:hypothetical protein